MFPCSSSSSSSGDHPSSSSGAGAGAGAAFIAASSPSFPANYLLHRSISSHSLFLYTNHRDSHISHGHHPYFSPSSSSPPTHHHHYLPPPPLPPPLPPPPPPPPPPQQQLCSTSSPSSSCEFLDFNPAPVRRVYSTGDLQGMNGLQVSAGESYNINGHEGGGIGGRVGRYSAEERKERIEKYRSKRNQRNFHKKITYACRKTLADSRPRVRGRFARNGEPETETEVEIETEAAENGYYENFDYNVCNNYDGTQNSAGGSSEKTLADSWPRVRGRLTQNVEAEMEVETEAAENGYCEDFGSNYNQTQNGGDGSGGNDSNTQWWPQTSALTDEEEDRCYVGDELWVEFGDMFSMNFLS